MGWLVLLVLLSIILGGLGFALHVLWWIALVMLVLLVVGRLVMPRGRGRRYRR